MATIAKNTFKLMTDNALSYLRLAPSDWANKPDQFAIKVYTAVELFLKARLLHEHWSLIVTKDPSIFKFKTGDFISVPFNEAEKRLRQIVDDPLSKEAHFAFDQLRQYRNRVVHFGISDAGDIDDWATRQIEARMLARNAWSELSKLIHGSWRNFFENHTSELDRIESNMERTNSAIGFDGKFREQKERDATETPVTDWFKPMYDPEEVAMWDKKLADEEAAGIADK